MPDQMIADNYERATGHQILTCFKERNLDPAKVEMMLVGSHAPFAWGRTPEKAVYNATVLEEVAKMAYLTMQINPGAIRLKDALIKKHFERKHGPNTYYGQS
jgi:L-ribulose-5-phosphate 4-epimerase